MNEALPVALSMVCAFLCGVGVGAFAMWKIRVEFEKERLAAALARQTASFLEEKRKLEEKARPADIETVKKRREAAENDECWAQITNFNSDTLYGVTSAETFPV